MKFTDVEDRVRQIMWPPLPLDLRGRILSAAAVVPRQSIRWSDRMWFSRAWRLSAVAVVLMLVGFDYLAGPPGAAGVAAPSEAQAEARVVEETGRQLGLSANVSASLARRVLSATTTARVREDEWTALGEFAPEGDRR